jgi:hypothetical protein
MLVLGVGIAYAEVPPGTVVIDNKAYSLKYVMRQKIIDKIQKEIDKAQKVYIKDINGQWYIKGLKEEVSKNVIPEIEYIDEKGNVEYYKEKDGEKLIFEVVSVAFINSSQLKVKFNVPLDGKTALNKNNYKTNGKKLGSKDSVELMEDGRTVLINLNSKMVKKNAKSSIWISRKIKSNNTDTIKEDYIKNILVLNEDYTTYGDKQEFDGDVNVIGNNISLGNMKIKGNIYVNGKDNFIEASEIDGEIFVDTIADAAVYISKCNTKRINVLSSDSSSVFFKGVKAEKLNVYGRDIKNPVKINISDRSEIKNTSIKSAAIFNLHSGSSTKNLEILPENKENIIELYGKFEIVEINGEGKINFKKGEIEKVIANIKSDLNIYENALISNIDKIGDKVNVKEIASSEENEQSNTSSGVSSSGSSGGSSQDTGNDDENNDNNQEEKIYITDAYILLSNGSEFTIDISNDGLKGKVDISGIGSKRIVAISMDLSVDNCTLEIPITIEEIEGATFREKAEGKNIEIDKDDPRIKIADNDNNGIGLDKIKSIAHGRDALKIKGKIKNEDDDSEKITLEIIVK